MRVARSIGLLVLCAACGRPASADARRRAAADSARGDSAALASLPPAIAAAFAVRAVLTREALRDTTVVRCEPRVMERLGRIFPMTYAVCPSCRHRQGIEARTNDMTCDRCHKSAAMAWDELS